MSKKLAIVLLVVVVVVALLYFIPSNQKWEVFYIFKKDRSHTTVTPGTSATPSTGNSVQGTGTVTYKCDQNLSFALTFSNNDTSRLSGVGLAPMTLTKTAVDYWISADGKTVVKPAGSYIVLVQNDKTVRDRCAK